MVLLMLNYFVAFFGGLMVGFCFASVLSLNTLNNMQAEIERLESEYEEMVGCLTSLEEKNITGKQSAR